MKRIAVYAASLDPITFGHINVIERAAPLYDELIVMVAVDPRKNYAFNMEDRVHMAIEATAHIQNVRVVTCIGRYVASFAKELGASVIVRGLRNASDLEAEQVLAGENREICPSIETIWLPCLPSFGQVSSSLVRSHVGADPEWATQVARLAPTAVVAKLKEKHTLERARKHWSDFMKVLGDPDKNHVALNELLARYGETHRAYHTIEHIVSMLDDASRTESTDTDTLLAIWFHDAIYDTHREDNEEQSANLLHCLYGYLNVPYETMVRATEFILATKHASGARTHRIAAFLDLDLAILGKNEEEFDRYDANIRKEYSWVPEDVYRIKRKEVLMGFLAREQIFITAAFHEKYEARARGNLTRAITQLSS